MAYTILEIGGFTGASPKGSLGQGMAILMQMEQTGGGAFVPVNYKLLVRLIYPIGGSLVQYEVASTTIVADGVNSQFRSVLDGGFNGGAPLGTTLDLIAELYNASGSPTGDFLSVTGFCLHDPVSGLLARAHAGSGVSILDQILAAVKNVFPTTT